jgi:hypothetical protein
VRVYEKKRILVVVKTYPNPSHSYGETVCCAGVDLGTGRWVRMYPITFRQLAERQFAKYQLIECAATAPRGDKRPESLRIDQDSIRILDEPLPSGPTGWRKRMALLPPPSMSLEEIRAAQAADGTSIGMFRPKQIERLVIEQSNPWTPRQESYLRQRRLGLGEVVAREMRELEHVPFTFSYRFRCDDARCSTGHQLQILDWEIGQSYRRWSRTDPERWEDLIRRRYEQELPARDLQLVVGNLAKHHQSFVIIGLVRPPRPKVDGGNVQQTLDLMGEQRPMAGRRVGLEAEQADSLGGDEGDEPLEFFPDQG